MSDERQSLAEALVAFTLRQAVAATGGGGTVLIIESPEGGVGTRSQPFEQLFQEAFTEAGLSPVVEFIPPPQAMETTGEAFPLEYLVSLLERHPEAAVVLIRAGFPRVNSANRGLLPRGHPPLMLVTDYLVPHLAQVPRDLLTLSVSPRTVPPDPAETCPPGVPDAVFRQYLVSGREW